MIRNWKKILVRHTDEITRLMDDFDGELFIRGIQFSYCQIFLWKNIKFEYYKFLNHRKSKRTLKEIEKEYRFMSMKNDYLTEFFQTEVEKRAAFLKTKIDNIL